MGLAIFNNQDYVPQMWHTALLMWAITLVPFIGNFWFKKILRPIEAIGAICHITFYIASIITLVVLAQHSSVEYVFQVWL